MRRYLWTIGLLSAAVLANEIALTRVFAYLIWYHGVFLIISMAMLGFAASGSILTLGGRFFQKHPDRWIRRGALLFGVFVLIGIFLPRYLPLESREISLRSISQLRNLAIYFVYWGVAFMMAGGAVVLILQREKDRINRVYFASMAGSGVGCLIAIGLLYVGPVMTLSLTAFISVCAAMLVPSPKNSPFFVGSVLTCIGVIAAVAAGVVRPDWKVAASKVEFHNLADGRILEEHWSPISVVQVFSPKPGWNYVDPGLAVHLRRDLPEQRGIIIDAYAQSVFTAWKDPQMREFDFFPDCSTSAAFRLREEPRVLVIGIGGGIDILRALYFKARSVVGVELNGVLVDLLRGPYRQFTGDLASQPQVCLVKDEGRSYVKHSSEEFDIIQIDYTDTWSAAASGGLALAENFLYTTEGIQDYYRKLSPDGILSITRTLSYPWPGETLRVTLTAIKALADLGVPAPRRHLMAVASVMENRTNPHMSATLLVCKRPFTPGEVEEIISQGRGRWVVIFRPDDKPLPAVTSEDAPLGEKYHGWVEEKVAGTRRIFASFLDTFPEDTSVLDTYPFDVSPLTDNRPFYYFFARWGNIWRSFKAGRLSGDAGGVILLVTLLLALSGSLIGIFLPLAIWRLRQRQRASRLKGGTAWYALYFACLGFGYISVELNLIQKYSLFLGHPVYALGVILGGLLILSGVGSYLSARVSWKKKQLLLLFGALILVITAVLALPGPLFRIFAGAAVWTRVLAMLAVLAPLGILMGMPFPLGLGRAGKERPLLIPWLWGTNGFTSVIGSILAAILAIAFGYDSVTWSAIVVYSLALIASLFLAGRTALPTE